MDRGDGRQPARPGARAGSALFSDGWYLLRGERLRDPSPESMLGGWRVAEDGTIGPFEPNPGYVPLGDSVTDPVHAVLRALADRPDWTELVELLIPTLRNSVVEIACDERGTPLVIRSPDGVPCVGVATAAAHRLPGADRWVPVLGARLVEAVPDRLDVLVNPADVARVRLLTEALRAS
ncbi:hypothetical protein SUDANB95_07958 (plasmid) [Actinosynnema sp. ALI-1.44]